jgi:hypothetical protein
VQNRNAFTPTASAVDAIVTMRDMASPVAAFVREKCELGSQYQIRRDELYSAYRAWCEASGHPRPTKEILGRDLRAAFPTIRAGRPRGHALSAMGPRPTRPSTRRWASACTSNAASSSGVGNMLERPPTLEFQSYLQTQGD